MESCALWWPQPLTLLQGRGQGWGWDRGGASKEGGPRAGLTERNVSRYHSPHL